jgi:hypothetical protein
MVKVYDLMSVQISMSFHGWVLMCGYLAMLYMSQFAGRGSVSSNVSSWLTSRRASVVWSEG